MSPSILCGKTLIANFSGKNKNRERKMQQYNSNTDDNNQDLSPLPQFQHLLRQLYKKSHPDLLRASNPDFAVTNDTSFQLLNGILSTIKVYNEHPAAMVKAIPFYVRNGVIIEKIDLKIRTGGGFCRRALTVSFEEFFIKAQVIDTKVAKGKEPFVWDKDYFPTKLEENKIV
jgi:hypothetical protein